MFERQNDNYRSCVRGEEMKMKLIMLFIVMDLLTFFAYPLLFVHHKLRGLSKPKGSGGAPVPVPIIVSTPSGG